MIIAHIGTGSSGAAEALSIMGVTYFGIMLLSALAIRKPHPSYSAPISKIDVAKSVVATQDVSLDECMRLPQFYFLGTAFFCLATGGMGMFSVAKPMMSEVFSSALPAVVTSAFAAKFLLLLSAGNLGNKFIFILNYININDCLQAVVWDGLTSLIKLEEGKLFTFSLLALYRYIWHCQLLSIWLFQVVLFCLYIHLSDALLRLFQSWVVCLPFYQPMKLTYSAQSLLVLFMGECYFLIHWQH